MIRSDELQIALAWIGHVDSMSGQICKLNAEGKPAEILFDFGCPHCSEVAPKNAEDYGSALVTIVEAAHEYLAYQRIVVESLDAVWDDMRNGAVYDNPMLAVSARIALRMLDRKQVHV
jgi:hypothetical protein